MRILSLAAVLPAVVLLTAVSARAQDLPTTEEYGITITPDDLSIAIQETQDFWAPVRKYLVGAECQIGDAENRQTAVVFLKRVHDGLHDRLFERTEEDAMDLIVYLGHRLRMFEVFRKARAAIANDAVASALIQHWEAEFRAIHALPKAEQAPRIEALLTMMHGAMESAGLPAATVAEVDGLWKIQTDVVEKMSSTAAGKMMIDFEIEAEKLPIEAGKLLLGISQAADWVLITRAKEVEIGREHFVKAHAELSELRAKYTFAAQAADARR